MSVLVRKEGEVERKKDAAAGYVVRASAAAPAGTRLAGQGL